MVKYHLFHCFVFCAWLYLYYIIGPNEEEIFKSPGTPKHIAAIKKGLDEGNNDKKLKIGTTNCPVHFGLKNEGLRI
jgi:hypothetical protein